MEHETGKALKAFQDEKDFKTARLWGQLFWIFPIGFIGGMIGGMGPVFGTIISVPFLVLCIWYKSRNYMYFICSIAFLILALINGAGVIGSIVVILLQLVGCLQNYQYIKFKKAIKAYEASLYEEQQINADAK